MKLLPSCSYKLMTDSLQSFVCSLVPFHVGHTSMHFQTLQKENASRRDYLEQRKSLIPLFRLFLSQFPQQEGTFPILKGPLGSHYICLHII